MILNVEPAWVACVPGLPKDRFGMVWGVPSTLIFPQLGLPKGVLTVYQSNRSAGAACARPGFPGGTAPPGFPEASGAWFPAPK